MINQQKLNKIWQKQDNCDCWKEELEDFICHESIFNFVLKTIDPAKRKESIPDFFLGCSCYDDEIEALYDPDYRS